MEIGLINNLTLLNDITKNLLLDDTLIKHLIISFNNTKFTAAAMVSGKFISIESFSFSSNEEEELELIFERLIHLSSLLDFNYQKTTYICNHHHVTIVPKLFYSAEKRNEYLNLTHQEYSIKDVISKSMNDKELVFALPLKFIDSILQKTPTAQLFHSCEYILENSLPNTLFINLQEDKLECMGFREKKELVFFNSFEVNNDIEIEFYINSILHKNKFISTVKNVSNFSKYITEIYQLENLKINQDAVHSKAEPQVFHFLEAHPFFTKLVRYYEDY